MTEERVQRCAQVRSSPCQNCGARRNQDEGDAAPRSPHTHLDDEHPPQTLLDRRHAVVFVRRKDERVALLPRSMAFERVVAFERREVASSEVGALREHHVDRYQAVRAEEGDARAFTRSARSSAGSA